MKRSVDRPAWKELHPVHSGVFLKPFFVLHFEIIIGSRSVLLSGFTSHLMSPVAFVVRRSGWQTSFKTSGVPEPTLDIGWFQASARKPPLRLFAWLIPNPTGLCLSKADSAFVLDAALFTVYSLLIAPLFR